MQHLRELKLRNSDLKGKYWLKRDGVGAEDMRESPYFTDDEVGGLKRKTDQHEGGFGKDI